MRAINFSAEVTKLVLFSSRFCWESSKLKPVNKYLNEKVINTTNYARHIFFIYF